MNHFLKLCLCFLVAARLAVACDSCALYVASGEGRTGVSAAVAQQFTRLGTVWQGADRLPNPVNQYLNSSITQLTLAYAPREPWQLQATLPYIRRTYLRPDHAAIERGRVAGIGDATVAARYVPLRQETTRRGWSLALLAGAEFGTGNADHLGDEIGHHFHHHAGFPDSGVHGHDLALGSGSTDFLLGADGQWRVGRTYLRAGLQHKLRRPGAFGYRFADETATEVGLGHFIQLTEQRSCAIEAIYSAEHKGFDVVGGEAQVDTGFSGRYAGGRIRFSTGEHLSGEFSAELPLRLRTSETMVVPDYRIRVAFTWRQ